MDRFADFNHYDPSQTRNVKEIPYADKLRGNGLTVITQGEKEFNAAIAGRPCLAVFFASWCGHCKRLEQPLKQIVKQIKDSKYNYKIVAVDCEEPGNEKLVEKMGVKGYPTLFIFSSNGKYVPYRGADREAQTIWNEMVKYM